METPEFESRGQRRTALVIAWCGEEPSRVGEAATVPTEPVLLGRGLANGLRFARQRPGETTDTGPLWRPRISHRQLRVWQAGEAVAVESVGLCPLLVDGQRTRRALVPPGSVIHLEGQLVLLCVQRPTAIPPLVHWPPDATRGFGEPDAVGLVGESPAMWALRDRLAFVARLLPHVLVSGASGTGKELAAQAIHRLSERSDRPIVARNAATIPATLVDAELFGNVRDYPNAGMRERKGLIGEADGSTLLLDEVGELPADLQAHLLRVLDAGEYQRLGDSTARHAALRLIAATNRDPTNLREELLARLPLRIEVPPLGARLEDVPLLMRHLLAQAARENPSIGPALHRDWDGERAHPRLGPDLVEALLRHGWSTHVRELGALLWAAIASSNGELALTDEVRSRLSLRTVPLDAPQPQRDDPTVEEIRAVLSANGGNVSQAWRTLGLPSRYALYRMLKRHGVSPR